MRIITTHYPILKKLYIAFCNVSECAQHFDNFIATLQIDASPAIR